MQSFKFWVGCCYICILTLSACNSKKSISGSEQMKSDRELQQAIDMHNTPFDWFSAKGSIRYKTIDESGKGTINVRMKKDSVIWFNIKKLGFEISSIMMTPDSVFIIYRWEKLYEKGRLDQFTRAYNTNLSFGELQDLFFGNVTATDNLNLVERDSTHYHVTAAQDNINYDYFINPYTLLLEKFYAKDDSHREVLGKYDEYKIDENGNQFSYFREYSFKENDEVTYLSLDYSDIEVDIPKKIKFRIPSHYDELY